MPAKATLIDKLHKAESRKILTLQNMEHRQAYVLTLHPGFAKRGVEDWARNRLDPSNDDLLRVEQTHARILRRNPWPHTPGKDRLKAQQPYQEKQRSAPS
jgi:hypothetical protein